MMKREIAPEELIEILKTHKEWLVREGRTGINRRGQSRRLGSCCCCVVKIHHEY
jgi:hypothetical protein